MRREEWIDQLRAFGVDGIDPEQQEHLSQSFDLQEIVASERALDELLTEGLKLPLDAEPAESVEPGSGSSNAAIETILKSIQQVSANQNALESLANNDDTTEAFGQLLETNPYAKFLHDEFKAIDTLLEHDVLPPEIENYDNPAARQVILEQVATSSAAATSTQRNRQTSDSSGSESSSNLWIGLGAAVLVLTVGLGTYVTKSSSTDQGKAPIKPRIKVVKSDSPEQHGSATKVEINKDPVSKDQPSVNDTTNSKRPLAPPETWLPEHTDEPEIDPTTLTKNDKPTPPIEPKEPGDSASTATPSRNNSENNNVSQDKELAAMLASLDPVDRQIILNKDFVENLPEAETLSSQEEEFEVVMNAELLSLVSEEELE